MQVSVENVLKHIGIVCEGEHLDQPFDNLEELIPSVFMTEAVKYSDSIVDK